MIEIKEITVDDAFRYPKPPRYTHPERTIKCICEKKINKIYMVNRRFGLCSSCGRITFDWRPNDERHGTDLNKEDRQAIKKTRSFMILLTEITYDFGTDEIGIPIRLTKNLETIDETIEALKVTQKMMQGKTVRSLKGIVNKIKYYFLGYILHERG